MPRKNFCPLHLISMRTDNRLDRIKDLALKTGGTENTCLSKPSASYHYNLNVSVLSLTLNPLNSEAYSCVWLLLPLPLMRAANPAQLLITKKGEKKKKSFYWFLLSCGSQLDKDGCFMAILGESLPLPLKHFFFLPSPAALPVFHLAGLDLAPCCSTPLTFSWGCQGTWHRISLSEARTRKLKCWRFGSQAFTSLSINLSQSNLWWM